MSDAETEIGIEDLPETLAVFPLNGVMLLPRGLLPLNIFEPRYLAMVDHAMRESRLIGMVQPCPTPAAVGNAEPKLYRTGCAGKIISFEETPDGRYHITLKGVSRFHIVDEADMQSGFRRVRADWSAFRQDMAAPSCLKLDRELLTNLLQQYFTVHGLSCNWEAIEDAPDEKLITCLAMVCPFEPGEKQALLEAESCSLRAHLFMAMLEMAVKADSCSSGCKH